MLLETHGSHDVDGEGRLLVGDGKAVRRLTQGHTLAVSDVAALDERPYWRIDYTRKTEESLEEATDHLDDLLGQVIEATVVSEVPVGITLSGGVDSSLLLARMELRKGEADKARSRLRSAFVGRGKPRNTEAAVLLALASHAVGNVSEYDSAHDLAIRGGADMALLEAAPLDRKR